MSEGTAQREAREADDAAERERATEDARRRVSEERAEAARVKAHGDAIAAMVALPLDALTDWRADNYRIAVTKCRDMLAARDWQEFMPRAQTAATNAMQRLSDAWTGAMDREAAERFLAQEAARTQAEAVAAEPRAAAVDHRRAVNEAAAARLADVLGSGQWGTAYECDTMAQAIVQAIAANTIPGVRLEY